MLVAKAIDPNEVGIGVVRIHSVDSNGDYFTRVGCVYVDVGKRKCLQYATGLCAHIEDVANDKTFLFMEMIAQM